MQYKKERLEIGSALLATLLCFLWGGLTPSVKLALTGMAPFALAGWRFLVALIVIWLFSRLRGFQWNIPRSLHRWLFLFGLIFAVQIGAINWGTALTDSSYAIVLLNTSPLFVAILAHLTIPNDKIGLKKLVGLTVAFVGVAVVFLSGVSGSGRLEGNILALASGVLLAVLQVFAKHLLTRISALQVVFWEMVYGVPLFFLFSFLFAESSSCPTSTVVISVLYQGAVIGGFCFLTWNYLLSRYAASQISAFQFSIPVFGVLLSAVVLSEDVSLRFGLGGVLVVLGIYLVSAERASSS